MFKFLELLHHFTKVNQTNFLSLNRQEKPQFYGHSVRSNVPLKFLKIYVLWRFFLKNKTCLNHEFFIIKKYRQSSFRSENFNHERPFFFELRAVEVDISFY